MSVRAVKASTGSGKTGERAADGAGARRLITSGLVGAGGAILALVLLLAGLLEPFEAKTFDMRARLLARPGAATERVATILIDQYSLDWCKENLDLSWPWPRETYRAIVDFCGRGGAEAVVFDMIYSEPSVAGVEDDRGFSDAMKAYGKTVGAMFLTEKKTAAAEWAKDMPDLGFSVAGLDEWLARSRPRLLAYPRAEFPLPELGAGMAALANVNLPPDAVDGVYRREPLFNVFDGRVVPSQALAAWALSIPGSRNLSIAPGRLSIGGRETAIDSDGRAILRYRGPTLKHPNKSAASVIQAETRIESGERNDFDPAFFKGKYVFVGVTAAGLFDLKPTPMSGLYPGVEVNATMLDNLLSGDFMRPLPLAATILLLLLLSAGAGMAASAVSGGKSALVYLAALPLAPLAGLGAYAAGYWLQVVALELGVAIALVGSSLVSYATEGKQKRYIKGAFKQYLSPAVIDELIAHPERLKLGGERRELSIFFSDMQGFTSVSEALTPEELTALLNDYLSAMTDIIQEEGGTIDKYEGDAIIAFWNAPLDLPDHATRAVRAALRCQVKLAELRPVFKARVGKDLFMRVGINSGPAVVGNMGSHTRFDYTMLGDAVNLASRLEGINKQYGTYTMISASTLKLAPDAYPVRELSRVAVVGRKEPVTVYEPMLPEEYAARKLVLDEFDAALRLYYAGKFAEAAAAFGALADRDPPSKSYQAKCRELIASPPAGEWNGVWVMTQK
jgi:adenylate cyclase